MNIMSTGIRINLTERPEPRGSCHTTSPDSVVDGSNNGRSAFESPFETPDLPLVSSFREVLLDPAKQRQPDWLRLRFNVGLFSLSSSARHFW